MRNSRCVSLFAAIAIGVATPLLTIGCGQSATAPSSPVLSGVTLAAASIAAGGNGQGTVSLTAAALTGGANISLSSSAPAVATVPASVTIPAGSSSATFNITAVTVGTATVTASFNGAARQSPAFTVTPAAVALASISLSAPSVVGGQDVTGAVTLTGAAPSGGAVVSLSSADPITVPGSVTVPSGSASTTFTVSTRVVSSTVAGSVIASYGGVNASAPLSVTQTPPIANFGVTGPSESDTCTLANGGTTLNCTFNGSSSTAPGTITAWDWTWTVAKTFAQTTSGPVLANPSIDCSLMPPPPLPPGNPWFTLVVTLTIHDNLGNTSAKSTHDGLRLLPQGACGF